MRRCMVEKFYKTDEPYEAWWHKWFINPDAEASAIIERDNGQVDVVYATQIHFLAPWGQEKVKEEK